MIIYYLDPSAWVKRYSQESGTSWMHSFFSQPEERELACATLGIVEVIATASRRYRSGAITADTFQEKINEIESDWKNFLQIQLTEELVAEAKLTAKKFALRGVDAVHFASALLLQAEFKHEDDQLVIVASDADLKEASRLSGIKCIDPQEQE